MCLWTSTPGYITITQKKDVEVITQEVVKAMVLKESGKDGEKNKEMTKNGGISNILRNQISSCFSAQLIFH